MKWLTRLCGKGVSRRDFWGSTSGWFLVLLALVYSRDEFNRAQNALSY